MLLLLSLVVKCVVVNKYLGFHLSADHEEIKGQLLGQLFFLFKTGYRSLRTIS